MKELLDNNDILMYSTHKEGKSVITGRFIKTVKSKTYKKLTANDSNPYLPYLNNLVDQYNNTYHHSINQKPSKADYSTSTETIESNSKALKFKVKDRVRIK